MKYILKLGRDIICVYTTMTFYSAMKKNYFN